nr:ADP-ribosylglycohydrolase family protein [Pararoseomonas indoligenes]
MNGPTTDRATGALVGLAVGDALGTTLEFTRRDTAPHHTEMTGGGPFGLKPGQWTDDTSMALALAESLLVGDTLDPRDLMDRFVRWWRTGAYSCTGTCFDIGITMCEALARYERTGDPLAGPTEEDTAGNGSVVRAVPVALYALDDPAAASSLSRPQSPTTHGAPQAVQGCNLLVALLRKAGLGADMAAVLAPRPRRGWCRNGVLRRGRRYVRTSHTHPLQIAKILCPRNGMLGITFCPVLSRQVEGRGRYRRLVTRPRYGPRSHLRLRRRLCPLPLHPSPPGRDATCPSI